ncbi:MAG: 2-C-methyl-D-erythritol 4-phosphate cytidylyltransferase [Acidimicrobiales bacterium]
MTSPLVVAIVLAAGQGTRFGRAKQFEVVGGERLVDRSVCFATEATGHPPVVALPAGVTWDGPEVAAAVTGGDSRPKSVRAALAATDPAADIVVIHDIAFPLASIATVRAGIAAIAAGADCAVPTWTLPDTIKKVRPDGTLEHIGREGYLMAQGPMSFRASMLRALYTDPGNAPLEDSIGIEQLGGRVVAVEGDRWSSHIVAPRDLNLVGRILDTGGLPPL